MDNPTTPPPDAARLSELLREADLLLLKLGTCPKCEGQGWVDVDATNRRACRVCKRFGTISAVVEMRDRLHVAMIALKGGTNAAAE